MHASNEDQYRLHSTDSDRFMALYRLRQMLDKKEILQDVYEANQERLETCVVKEETRHGLRNLLRSPTLAEAVAQALQHPHLRPGFNASTWGKKLTKGRFYQASVPDETGESFLGPDFSPKQLVACLIEEMVEQCSLLRGDSLEVSPKPFQLAATSCEWKRLQTAEKKKEHAWKELPGGVSGALERVKIRPDTFVNVLNPTPSEGWTFDNVVSKHYSRICQTAHMKLRALRYFFPRS